MKHEVMWILICGLIFSQCLGQEPRYQTCVGKYVLSFFYERKTFAQAKTSCEAYDGESYLVKVDSAEITKAIDSIIEIGQGFAVGAEAITNSGKRTWRWLDGSKVNLPEEKGYENWKPDQPNNNEGQENCMILGKWHSKQWIDSNCGETNPPEYFDHICQKKISINIAINSSKPNEKLCTATAASCQVQVEWRRNNVTVSNMTDHTVYQTASLVSSNLHHENATIRDAGEYVCEAWLKDHTSDPLTYSKSKNITVSGTPTITNIKSFPCTTSLLVSWKSHRNAIGFTHKIMVETTSNRTRVKIITVKPNNADQLTEVTGLQSSRKYNVKITACRELFNCPDEFVVNKTATTKGTVLAVINATLRQIEANNTCILTWEWPYNTTTQFQIILNSRISDYVIVNETENNFSYSFNPSLQQVYDVGIRPGENENYCSKLMKAIGSCVGKEPTDHQNQQINRSTIIIPVIAGVAGFILLILTTVLVIRKRMSKPNQKDNVPPSTISNDPVKLGLASGPSTSQQGAYVQDIEENNAAIVARSSDQNDDVYTMASDLHSSTQIYAVVNKLKNRTKQDSTITAPDVDNNTTYDTLHTTPANVDTASSSTYGSLTPKADQDVYAVVDKSKNLKKSP